MARLNIGLIVLVLVVGNVAGCKPASEADLSPDGKTAAITRDRGLVFHDTTGQVSDRHVSLEGPESPVFSPDGKWVVVAVGKKTFLVEESTGFLSSIPQISPPYAWKPDGTELCGIHNNKVVVIHIRSKDVCRTYPLPETPEHAIWLGAERDLAFSRGHKLFVLSNGKVQSQTLEGTIQSIVQADGGKSIVLTEVFGKTLPKHIQPCAVRVQEVPINLKSPPKLIWKATDAEALMSNGRFCVTSTSLVSPDGKLVVNVGMVDQSKPGLLEEIEALGGFGPKPVDPKLMKRFQLLEKQIRFAFVVTYIDPRSLNPHPAKLFTEKSNRYISSTFWSKDSQKICVLTDDKLIVKPISRAGQP